MHNRANSPPLKKLTLTVGADCLLTGAGEKILAAIRAQLTMDNPKYREAQRYGRWVGKDLKPKLLFFTEVKNGIRFPRGFARQAIMLAREQGENPLVEDLRRSLPEENFCFTGELRPYQEEAVQRVMARDFGVLEAGTGSGKTVVALAVIARRRQPTIVLVHTKELLHQWAERIRRFLGIEPGLIGDGLCDIQPVTVAIVNSARIRIHEILSRFGHLCVDECHRTPATLFTDVVTSFDCRYMLGLSATAFRRDGLTKLISHHLGECSHRINSHALEQTGAVLRPKFIQHETSFHYNFAGSYSDLIQALTQNEARNQQIVRDILAEIGQTSGAILVVSDRLAHCESLAALLAEKHIDAPVLSGRLGGEERTELIDKLLADRLKVLVATIQLIGEGFDAPGLSSLFLTTPIKFTGRLRQVVGRILRPADGKTPRVHDYADPVGVLRGSAKARITLYGG